MFTLFELSRQRVQSVTVFTRKLLLYFDQLWHWISIPELRVLYTVLFGYNLRIGDGVILLFTRNSNFKPSSFTRSCIVKHPSFFMSGIQWVRKFLKLIQWITLLCKISNFLLSISLASGYHILIPYVNLLWKCLKQICGKKFYIFLMM